MAERQPRPAPDRLERIAAGCLLASFDGTRAPAWVQARIAGGLGGIVLFAGNVRDPAQLARLTGALRAGRPQLLIAADEEGGEVTRLEAARGSSQPAAAALGTLDEPLVTAAVAGALARSLRRAGVGLNLAPVADLLPPAGNPALGSRAFGGDAALVARHVAAFVAGTQREGIAACAKHFPGHGGTTLDSHLALPRFEGDLEAALLPFRAALAAGVRAVMPGHLVVPALDAAPASLSRALLGGLLREQLGFDGLIVTDALDMGGVLSAAGSVEEAAVRALDAGADALCLGPAGGADAVDAVVAAVVAAIRAGRLARRRVEQAAERVAATATTLEGVPEGGGIAEGRAVGARAAASALVAAGDPRVRGPLLVVALDDDGWSGIGRASAGLAAALRRLDGAVEVAASPLAVPPPPLPGGTTVVAVRDAGAGSEEQMLLMRLIAEHPRVVVVETGTARSQPAGAAGWVRTGGAARVSLDAAAALLLGRTR